jgi:upstream activation factor subunit UAF30
MSEETVENRVEKLESIVKILQAKILRQERAFRRFKKSLIPESERVPRKPSGFAKPSVLSDALCEFLEIPLKSELARTDVTKKILQYVKDNNLQNPEEKRYIILDDKLNKLLNPKPDEKVTYFNIQRLLKIHYPPSKKTVLESVPETDKKKDKPKKKKKNN